MKITGGNSEQSSSPICYTTDAEGGANYDSVCFLKSLLSDDLSAADASSSLTESGEAAVEGELPSGLEKVDSKDFSGEQVADDATASDEKESSETIVSNEL